MALQSTWLEGGESINQKNLTENLLFVGCFTSQTKRTSLQLVFQPTVAFFEGLFNN